MTRSTSTGGGAKVDAWGWGIAIACALAGACTLEEDLVTEAGAELRFSVDTLRFDTVFAEVGSATRSFKIYNPFDRPLEIARVSVSDEAGGRFRINVDGRSGEVVRDVFLPADDSVYVFVEVTVDPSEPVAASPFVFAGAVEVTATDATQVVHLEAFGQNAVYLPGPGPGPGADFRLLTCDLGEAVFGGDLPYVIYGSLVIDSCTVTLPPGTRLYVHGGIARNPELFGGEPFNDGVLLVGADGRLVVDGTAEEPVLIASDRLEEEFLTVGGQYGGLRLGAGSGPHRISHARIRNGINGLVADSAVALAIDHTEISYVDGVGLYAYQADVDASNLAIHSTGSAALAVEKGGTLRLDYGTLVNIGSRESTVALLNWTLYPDSTIGTHPLDARLRNVIAFGSEREAFALSDVSAADDAPDEAFDLAVEHSVVRSDLAAERPEALAEACDACLFVNADSTIFLNPAQDTFLLDTLSVARGIARPLDVLDDLTGVVRDPEAPDAGAYEYVEPE